jgi:hypothetical protein
MDCPCRADRPRNRRPWNSAFGKLLAEASAMKQAFFFGLLVLLPVVLLGGGVIYLAWHAFYTLYDDWRLNKELKEIKAASAARRKKAERESENPSGDV